MAINGKTIKGYAEKDTLTTGDAFLFQRGNQYYNVDATKLLSGANASDTRANVNTLLTAGTLAKGATYYLTDKYIWVRAFDVDKIEYNALFFARNPDYQSAGDYSGITIANGFTVNATGTNLGVWQSNLSPAQGDVVIWDGLHWLNLTGAVGTAPDGDAVNWQSVANTDIDVADTYGYIYEVDPIEYDFAGDSIKRRVDLRGNDISGGISTFQWGNNKTTNNVVMPGGDIEIYNAVPNTSINGNLILPNGKLTISEDQDFDELDDNYINTQLIYTTRLTATSADLKNCTINYPYNTFTIISQANTLNQIQYATWNFNDTYRTSGYNAVTHYHLPLSRYAVCSNSDSTHQIDIDMNPAAYAGGTTYHIGDMVDDGTGDFYVYINAEGSAGNAPPNATYWFRYFDGASNTFFVDSVFATYGDLQMICTGGVTVAFTRWDAPLQQRLRLTPSGGNLTMNYTAFASLANQGEYISDGNNTINGTKNEWLIVEYVAISGTQYIQKWLIRDDIA